MMLRLSNKIAKGNIVELCYWFVGFNSLLMIFRQGIRIIMYGYTLCIIILAVNSIWYLLSNRNSATDKWVLLKLFSYISAIMVSFSFAFEFGIKNITNCFSILLVLIVMLKKPNVGEWSAFASGLKLSLVIDLIYAGVEFVVKSIFNYNITSTLLYYLGLRGDPTAYALSMSSRIAGLSWDPFVLGGCCAVSMFLFNQNNLFRLYILVILMLSGSRAGILGVFVAIFIGDFRNLSKKRKYLLAGLIIVIAAILYHQQILNFVFRGLNTNSHGYMRVEYIKLVPDVMEKSNILQTIFGGAPSHSGGRFFFSKVPSMINNFHRTPYWAIESDWGNSYYGRGIIGFFIYIFTYMSLIKRQKSRKYRLLYISILFMGVGYYYDTAIYINLLLYFTSHFQIENTAFDNSGQSIAVKYN